MIYRFSDRSFKKLNTCDERLIQLMSKALNTSPMDFSVICGHRGKEEQNKEYDEGDSKVRFPYGKHNSYPSKAADIQPYPYTQEDIDDKENTKFKILTNHILKVADNLDIDVINGGFSWGWDWFHWELL